MQLAIYNRNLEEKHIPVFTQFFAVVKRYDIDVILFEDLYQGLKGNIDFGSTPAIFSKAEDLAQDIDFFIGFGGDGTILDAILFVGNKNIPILGINLGRLGFLADIRQDDIEHALQCLQSRNYTVESRDVLKLDSNTTLFESFPYALNDFTIHKKDTSAMIKIDTYLNGQFLTTYWCDGLIVSTPTGSTGYSLSCGGPVIFPQTDAFVITPISPHNLNIRPIVVPNDYVISFEVEGRAEHFLCTLDSRQESIDKNVLLAVRKGDFRIKLVHIASNNFLDTIRNKMHWGIDSRN